LGRLGLGVEYGQERINSTNLGKHLRQHKSIFSDQSKDLNDKFSLGLSFRFDDFDTFGKVYTGSSTVKLKLSAQDSVHLGASRNMRIPSFTELYYNDPTTLGDAGLSAEKSLNYQAGYAYQKENFSWGATFFIRQEKDFIDWVKRSSSQVKWQAENISQADVSGIESYLKLEINSLLALSSNYTYINKRTDDKGYLYKYGPNFIRHLANTGIELTLPFGAQSLEVTYKKKPRRNGWCLVSSHFSYKVNKTSKIFLNISNLFNVEYQEIEGIPCAGRWIEAGLRLEW
jgi:vitamin B12 transporter